MFTPHRPTSSRRVRAGAALLATLLPASLGGFLTLGGRQSVEALTDGEPLMVVFEQAPAAIGPPLAPLPGRPRVDAAPTVPSPEAEPEPSSEAQNEGGPALADLTGADTGGGGGGCEGVDCLPQATCTGPDCGGSTPGPRQVHWSAVKVTRQVEPRMPSAARTMAPQQVTCVVRMSIDTRGRVTAVDPVNCPVAFRQSTTEAGLKWRFEPMRVDGQALDASFLLTVRYDIE